MSIKHFCFFEIMIFTVLVYPHFYANILMLVIAHFQICLFDLCQFASWKLPNSCRWPLPIGNILSTILNPVDKPSLTLPLKGSLAPLFKSNLNCYFEILNYNISIANSKFDYLNFQKQIGLIAKQILQKRFYEKWIISNPFISQKNYFCRRILHFQH